MKIRGEIDLTIKKKLGKNKARKKMKKKRGKKKGMIVKIVKI